MVVQEPDVREPIRDVVLGHAIQGTADPAHCAPDGEVCHREHAPRAEAVLRIFDQHLLQAGQNLRQAPLVGRQTLLQV
eukprot:CAMPEP_0175292710 /NCGR_PEP_ID=MMETSP0093-20121207/57084_1 /TAXON_ID=311494 /ORGANISM="Alexandrium monilatum, Strain CCMP3105" /LENGTH=77 /DNA_ID=CAMNT_0016588545 /DNA_START=146 /DNA_END=375 /DNA_ORIENTATION=+